MVPTIPISPLVPAAVRRLGSLSGAFLCIDLDGGLPVVASRVATAAPANATGPAARRSGLLRLTKAVVSGQAPGRDRGQQPHQEGEIEASRSSENSSHRANVNNIIQYMSYKITRCWCRFGMEI